tara:strand:- start:15 stop:575 length:561 start_codon:yes stop_codon:yes gene_type:complete
MASHVKAADTDADGQLDFDEYMAYVRAREGSDLTDEALWKRFDALDRDGSGQIDMAEMNDVVVKEPLATAPMRGQWVEEEGQRTANAYRSFLDQNMSENVLHKMALGENIAAADADGGGTIDTEEFAILMAAAGGDATKEEVMTWFKEADKDGDGELTEEELKKIGARKKAARKAGKAMGNAAFGK